jgi:hypothetical protein
VLSEPGYTSVFNPAGNISGVLAMYRRAGLFVFFILAAGCAGDTSALWDPALKDLRGDNQQMRTLQGGSWGSDLPKGTMSIDH